MLFCDISLNKHNKIKEDKNHIYIAPHPLLRKYIAHYTISFPDSSKTIKNNDAANELTLIPDCSGCIIFTYENNDFSSSLWGATTKTVTVKNDVNSQKVRFFIEFMPGGLRAITGINQSELCDIQAPIDDVDRHLYQSLSNVMETSQNMDEMISRTNRILLEAIYRNNKQQPVIDSILFKVKLLNGDLTIKELASSEYISERHLNRLVNEYMGVNVKMFLRLTRVNNAIKLLKNIDDKNCFDIVHALGFYDQAHFINDFRQLCNVSPKEFIKNMSDFYNEQFKY